MGKSIKKIEQSISKMNEKIDFTALKENTIELQTIIEQIIDKEVRTNVSVNKAIFKTEKIQAILKELLPHTNEGCEKETNKREEINMTEYCDIKKLINITDYFCFQRELFNNSKEGIDNVIDKVNQFSKYEEVENFLQSKYNWEEENIYAEGFMNIIKQRFEQK